MQRNGASKPWFASSSRVSSRWASGQVMTTCSISGIGARLLEHVDDERLAAEEQELLRERAPDAPADPAGEHHHAERHAALRTHRRRPKAVAARRRYLAIAYAKRPGRWHRYHPRLDVAAAMADRSRAGHPRTRRPDPRRPMKGLILTLRIALRPGRVRDRASASAPIAGSCSPPRMRPRSAGNLAFIRRRAGRGATRRSRSSSSPGGRRGGSAVGSRRSARPSIARLLPRDLARVHRRRLLLPDLRHPTRAGARRSSRPGTPAARSRRSATACSTSRSARTRRCPAGSGSIPTTTSASSPRRPSAPHYAEAFRPAAGALRVAARDPPHGRVLRRGAARPDARRRPPPLRVAGRPSG